MKSSKNMGFGCGTHMAGLFHKICVAMEKMKNAIWFFCKNTFEGIIKFFRCRSSESSLPEPEGTDQWKTRVLEDFKVWLAEVPAEAPSALSVTPDTCDLYTLFSEFTGLKQEIKMQNREQLRTLKALTQIQSMTDAYKDVMEHFNNKTKSIATLEQNIRRETEKRTVLYFLDIRDTLIRGSNVCAMASSKKGFFRRVPKNMDNIHESYDMAIRKFDASLALLDIFPMETDGVAFDPMTMKALEVKQVPGMDKGTVVETVSGGFKRGNVVLRHAQVIVAEG